MNANFAMTFLVCGMLIGPCVTMAQDSDSDSDSDSDADRSHAKAFVKDSAITTKIKTKLAAEHITSLGRIHVDALQRRQEIGTVIFAIGCRPT
jgi:hypothetical protein